jgi:hypothetical protein
MMTQNDADGHEWSQDTGEDLHLSDFVFLARMQTAHRLSQRVTLGADPYLPCEQIESFLRVIYEITHKLPSG